MVVRLFGRAAGGFAAAAALFAGTVLAQPGQPGTFDAGSTLELYNTQDPEFIAPAGTPFGAASAAPAELPPNVDVAAVRRGLDAAARDASALYDSLNGQVRYAPAVRTYLASVLQLRARAGRLSQTVRTAGDLQRQVPELKALDSDWRLLSYNLKQVRELDRTALDLIARLDATDESLGKMLQMGPSINYRELIAKTGALVQSLDRLVQDIDYELGRTSQARDLIIDGQRVQQAAQHLADYAFAQSEHARLSDDFKLFQQYWSPYLGKLRTVNNRTIDRDVQRVQQVEREVSALLWQKQTIDRQQLLYLTKALERDVDDFFSRAPLKMLIKLPQADQALPTADAFYGVFENFIDCVNRGENVAELQDAFRYINDNWKDFSRVYRPLNSGDAQQVLNGVEKDVAALRQGLLVADTGLDRTRAGDLAATIENLAGYLDRDTRSWLQKERPPYASDAQHEVAHFVADSRELHAAIVGGADIREVRQMADALFETWRRVYGYVVRCQTSERPHLASTSSQTTPALVELRTLLAR